MEHLEKVKEIRSESFGRHCNCCQAVLMAFAKEMNMTEAEAESLGQFFGGGMMHGSICGSLSGAFMVLGKMGFDRKTASDILKKFREKHDTTQCVDLLTASKNRGIAKKEHCDGLIFEVVEEIEKILENRE